MSIFSRVKELEKRNQALEDMVISLAQTVAELSEKVDKHDEIIEHLDEYIGGLMNQVANEASKQLTEGIDQVLNFTPYGRVRNG